MESKKKEKLWNKSYIILMLLSVLTSMGFSMVTPIIAKYAISLGATVSVAGIIAGIFSLTALVGRPISGYIADCLNKKYIMVAATFVLAITCLGYGISSSIFVLLVFRILHGLAFSVSGTANITLATIYIPKDRLGEGIGFLGLGMILSRAVGPNLSIIISEKFGYSYVFYFAFIITLLSAGLMMLFKYNHVPHKRNGDLCGKHKIKISDFIAKELIILVIIVGFFSMMNGLISNFIVNLAEEKNIADIGLYFTVNAVTLILIRPFAGKLLDRKRLVFIALPAFVLSIIAGFLLSSTASLYIVLVAAALFAIGQGSSQPGFQTECIKKLGSERVGVATSTYYIGADIGNGIGPMVGGIIAGALGFGAIYVFGSVALIIGMLLFLNYEIKERRKEQT